MAEQDITVILDRMAGVYTGGAYPGRNSEGLNPEWPCDPFHVLIATILSQRTKDDNTRKASDNLFHKYPTVEAIADADPADVAVLIRPAGFPNQKAKAITECCRILRDQYGCRVPEDTEEMTKLPMVGRKTAACVRSYAMDIPSVCVDTHVHRISNLMGLVRHGQEICQPNRPHCDRCMVSDMCQYAIDRK